MPRKRKAKATSPLHPGSKASGAEALDTEQREKETDLSGLRVAVEEEDEGVIEQESQVNDAAEEGDEREGGEGDDEREGEEGGGGTVKKSRIAGLYQPPTHDELRTLKETHNLFQSNLMRLQIKELLAEVRSPPSTELDQFLTTLRETLMSIPATGPVDLCDAVKALPAKTHYPIELDPSPVKGKMAFQPPVTVKVVGSYLLRTAIKPSLNVDLALQIPLECLQAKDHLNYRYLHKRALYLSHIATHLRRKKTGCGLERVEFGLAHGGPLSPILLLTPAGKPLSQYSIRLHTTIPEAPFKPVKLVPDRNNVRRQCLRQFPPHLRSLVADDDSLDEGAPSSEPNPANLPPTPHYNSLILRDMGAMERHLSDVYTAQQECPAMADAVVLFRIWARQRGLDQGYRGYTGFHFSLLLALLLGQRKVSGLMSSYQILRVGLQAVASSDWSTAGVSMATQDPSLPSLTSFHAHHDVVFLDSSGLLNILSHLSLSRYSWLRHEAAVTLAALDNPAVDGFATTFMTPVPFETKFDLLIHLSPANSLHSLLTRDTDKGLSLLLDGGPWPLPLIMRQVLALLCKGLGNRASLLTLRPLPSPKWLPSKEPVSPCDNHVTVGVALDPDHAYSVLDMGPAADNTKQAGEFRAFWGEKAELRRFQDGSINEAVVWSGRSIAERRGVVTQVVTHLLNRHVGVSEESVTSSANLLTPLLSTPPSFSQQQEQQEGEESGDISMATGEEEGKMIEDTFTELSKQLRGLKGLPLAINSVQGASAEFRHCSVFPARPWSGRVPRRMLTDPSPENQSDCLYPSCDSATPPFVPALEVVLQLEGSSKWPTQFSAISSVKTAFYTFLSRALSDQCQLLCSPTSHCLDVLKDGYVFRLRIHCPRELAALRETVSVADKKSHEVTRLRKVLADLQRQLVNRPLLTSILHGLSLQHSAFGPGTRLCKRWAAAHLMTNHITEEAIELMVARLFLHPDPFTTPKALYGDGWCHFCRTPEVVLMRFLSLLSSHDWETEPLIVNLNNELSASDLAQVRAQFSSQRDQLPPCYIATPLHQDSSPLTFPSPSFPVFHRLCLLAKESLTVLSGQMSSPNLSTSNIKQVFRTPLTGFNVMIHLHKKHVPLAAQAVDAAMETGLAHHTRRTSKKPTHFPVTDFNPVERYLRELEAAFSQFCLFFYDKYGGRCIAVVWKPKAFVPQPFKVAQVYCKTKVAVAKAGKKKSESLFVPDVEAILADFELMGEGLVSSVEQLTHPPQHTN